MTRPSAPPECEPVARGLPGRSRRGPAANDVDRAQRLDEAAEAVWDAVRAGSAAALDYLQDEAGYSRTGYHGAIPRDPTTGRKLADHSTGQFVDAHEWVVASFAQHTSRNGDPQMHIHNATLNRVECPDGQWRTIDSRGMRKARAGAAAIGERVMEEQLTRTLGVEFAMRPDGKAREILGIDQATRDLYSSRRSTITRQVAGLGHEVRETSTGTRPPAGPCSLYAVTRPLDKQRAGEPRQNTVPREVSLAGWRPGPGRRARRAGEPSRFCVRAYGSRNFPVSRLSVRVRFAGYWRPR